MEVIKKCLRVSAFVLLIVLAGIGIPLGGALPNNIQRRLKSGDDKEKTEMVEREDQE